MKKLHIYLFLVITGSCIMSNAQDKLEKKANEDFDAFVYANAITNYEKLIEKDQATAATLSKLADAYYFNGAYEKASKWYQMLLEKKDTVVAPEYMYRYALCLKTTKNYTLSDQWMEKFSAALPNDKRSQLFQENRDYLNQIKKKSNLFSIETFTSNSNASDLAAAFYNNELVLSSTRKMGILKGQFNQWDNQAFQDLYITEALEEETNTKIKSFSKRLTSKANEPSLTFSKDGNTVYFTRNNFNKNGFERDEDGFSRLKIYRAKLQDNRWTDIEALPFCSDHYSVAHPALSADGNTLYFASDMPGSFGASDIYSVAIYEDGSFGTPVNLGPTVNTPSRETFPTISADQTLYFASDGHPGLGGLDIYAASPNFNCVTNLGSTINSELDDFNLVFDDTHTAGFFTSNRTGGLGSDDIYAFKKLSSNIVDCTFAIKGAITNTNTGNYLEGVHIQLVDNANTLIEETTSDKKGTFLLNNPFKGKQNYTLIATKDGYNKETTTITPTKAENVLETTLQLQPIEKPADVGTKLITYLKINPTYFETNSAELSTTAKQNMDKVILYMKKFPNVKIKVLGHADAKGSITYNNVISEKRANAGAQYMIANGIDENRIQFNGLGKSQLVNDCNVFEKCSDEENRLNRRLEFIVIE